ncbi:MAG: ATP synthase F0 subunit C [bacterium]|jgi:F-type H+-transporting ATPase subunit c
MLTGSVAGIGAGLVAIGAGLGIGLVGAAAVGAIARQPEMTAKIQVTMLIVAALVEGTALFCAVICLLGK